MKIRELMDFLTKMDPEKDAFVALFRADRTAEIFDIADVSNNNGNAQINIHEEKEVDD